MDIFDFTTTQLLFRGPNRGGKPQKSKHLTAENAEIAEEKSDVEDVHEDYRKIREEFLCALCETFAHFAVKSF